MARFAPRQVCESICYRMSVGGHYLIVHGQYFKGDLGYISLGHIVIPVASFRLGICSKKICKIPSPTLFQYLSVLISSVAFIRLRSLNAFNSFKNGNVLKIKNGVKYFFFYGCCLTFIYMYIFTCENSKFIVILLRTQIRFVPVKFISTNQCS